MGYAEAGRFSPCQSRKSQLGVSGFGDPSYRRINVSSVAQRRVAVKGRKPIPISPRHNEINIDLRQYFCYTFQMSSWLYYPKESRYMESNTTKKLNEDEMVTLAQQCLSELGITEAAIYPHKRIVRIQVAESDFDRAIQIRETIVERMKTIGYRFVALDFDEKAD